MESWITIKLISAKLISANKTVQREEYQDAVSIFF